MGLITLGVSPVSNAGAGGASTVAVTINGVTAGNSLVVLCEWFGVTTISSITISGESNATVVGSPAVNATGTVSAQTAYLANVTTGGNKTVTLTLSGTSSTFNITVLEIVGANKASFVDASANYNSGAGSVANTNSTITTVAANAALFASISANTGVTPTAGSGFTSVFAGTFGATEYKLNAGAAGSQTVAFVHASTGLTAMAMLSVAPDPNSSATPPAGTLTLTGLAPTVAVTVPVVRTPVTGALTFTVFAPEISGIKVPNPGSMALTSFAPSIGTVAKLSIGALSFSTLAPTVTNTTPPPVVLAPLAGAVSFTTTISGTALNGPVALEVITGYGVSEQSPFTRGSATLQFIMATGISIQPGSAAGTASLMAIAGVGYGPVYGAASLRVLTAIGRQGNYTTGIGVLQPLRAPDSYSAGYVALERISAAGYSRESLVEIYLTKTMNTRSSAVTEYQNYNFNSYAFINGDYYAAGPGGLYKLDGSDDNGANIDWSFRTGQMDDKTPLLKRIPEIVLGLRASGPVRVRVYKDDNTYFDYMLPATNTSTIHQQRVQPGKGMRSRYYSIELQGVSNSEAAFDSMQVNMTKTTRRID